MINKWVPDNTRLSSTMFRCPYCNGMVYYNHGASSRSKVDKECLYKHCPWCARVVIDERNYTDSYDDKCGTCKWLDTNDKSAIGFRCVSPHRNGDKSTASRKQRHNPKCKNYEVNDGEVSL